VYHWDLDRTYLDTDIHSVRGMVRAAFEHASSKRNIPGAAALLRGLIERDPTCRVSIISGSPRQMRDVLAEKLALDGVRFDSMVLKDSLRHLRKGRFRAIKGQVGYKLPQLLKTRVGFGKGVRESLFGDDTEVDALVYTLYAEAIAGRVNRDEVARIMEAGGAYTESVESALRSLRRIGRADAVEDIFIHAERGLPLRRYHLLGPRVIPVFSWFQAALVLWKRGRLEARAVVSVANECMTGASLDERSLASLVQDLVRRRRLEETDVERLMEEATGIQPVAPLVREALQRLGPLPAAPEYTDPPDFLAFLRAAH
jgi:hypothetical protein